MPEDPALIWEKEPHPRRRPSAGGPPSAAPGPAPPPPADLVGERIPLREAHRRFGVAVSTLRGWARSGKIEAALEDGRWMAAPASIAAHLSARRRGSPTRAPLPRREPSATGASSAPRPADDGSAMLVPRDAWDKLMDQLGNLHEAGQQLAVARERAARAETEALFLRDRLGELRSERDRLRDSLESTGTLRTGPTGGIVGRLRRALWGER